MVPLVRAAALGNYFEVAHFVGLDPHRMLRRAGIDPASLADPDNQLPGLPVGILLEDSARESGCLSFGLLMAECRTMASLGPIGLLLRHQASAREALEGFIGYQRLITEAFDFSIEEADGTAIIRTGFIRPYGRRQTLEYAMGLICRATSEVVGARWHPDKVHLVHSAPPDLAIHHRLFQCPLEFEAGFCGFTCSTASLDTPNPDAESAMARHARRYLDMLIPDPVDGSIGQRARRALYLLLPAGRGTLEQAAANLGIHPRNMQRALEKEGRTFATLANEVRRELALRYLANPSYSVMAVAQMSGYSNPSSFSRWFVAEFGMSPAAWRAEERLSGEPPGSA